MTKYFRGFSGLCLLLCVINPLNVHAQITVSRSILEFSPTSKVQDLELHNSAEHNMYVDLSVTKIINPESEKPERVLLDDPRSADVLVNPKQLVLKPGQRKRIRVILRNAATDVDNVYRLAVKPHIGELVSTNEPTTKKGSALKMLIGYNLLLISRPEKLNTNLQVERTDNAISFHNQGNTNFMLRRMEQCEKASGNCSDLETNRLYAGQKYTVKLPMSGSKEDYPVKILKSVLSENTVLTF